MAAELYPFLGALDLDSPVEVFKKGFLSDARNVIARGQPGNMRYENIPGTRLIFDALPAGTNSSIGSRYDSNNHRIFDFNWNSNGNHAIYITDIITETTQTLINDGAVLNFDADFPISSIDIFNDPINGDILYWVNSQGIPCQINISQALAGDYGTYRTDYLTVIKQPADAPPGAVYVNNSSATVNNLRKQLFKFKTFWEFNNHDKSVTSSQSVEPLPIDAGDTTVDADPTKNSQIALVIQTGPSTVKSIHICGAINAGTTYGDYFEIDKLDKAALGIPDNDIYIYRFNNDKAYISLDIAFSDLPYDNVPKKCGAGVLLNGDTPAYGDITEGFDLLTSFGNSAATAGLETYRRTQPKVLFMVAQNGESIGDVGNNIHAVVLGTVTGSDLFSIYTTNYTISYLAAGGDTTADVINALATVAAAYGFTVVSSDANNLVIHKAAQQMVRYYLSPFNTTLGVNDATFVYDWWSRFGFGIVYFDFFGRTNGAVITSGFNITTSGYAESSGTPEIPTVQFSIYHQPPDWAYYYQIVRTKNLSKARIRQWISDRTFKDDIPSADGYKYAYISIESLNQYIKDKPSASFLAYDFAPGDRIRFIKLYPTGGITTAQLETNKDFEIQQSVLNPIINGIQYQGQFLKIYLPATETGFDFGIQFHAPFLSDIDYSNYFIELYTPALSATENLNKYFEFGERYAIANPTLSTRFHQGMTQNQTPDYVTPATFLFTQGDFYLRFRTINAAPEFKYTLVAQDIGQSDFPPMTLDSTYNAVGYTAKAVDYQHLTGNLQDSNDWMINVTDGNGYTFNVKGNIVMSAINSSSSAFTMRLIATDTLLNELAVTIGTGTAPVTAGTQYNFTVDTQVTIPATYTKLFLLLVTPDSGFQAHIISGDLTLTDAAKTFTQLCIDENFSDSFQSAVNSNGRAWVFDPNAKEVHDPVLMRYGLNDQTTTNTNDSNRFYPQNSDRYDGTYGAIVRFTQVGKELRVYQYRKCGSVGIYNRWVKQNNQNVLITSDTIITPNNIYYLNGDYGIGNQPLSLAITNEWAEYFADPIKGYLCRRSLDGVTPISDLYRAQSWAGTNLQPYQNNYPYAYGGFAKLLGVFQFHDDRSPDYICFGQASQYNLYGLAPQYGIGEALAFNEQENMFRSKYDINPDNVICAENKLYAWVAGKMYIFDNTSAYGNFFGQHHDAVVQFPMREPESANKSFMSLSYNAPMPQYNIDVKQWLAPNMGDVLTSQYQISNLVVDDFNFQNAMYRADFQRDNNSDGGVNDGDQLQGLWMQLRLSNASSILTWISNLYIVYQTSQRNF